MKASSGDPDQTPHYVALDLGLHCLLLSQKKDARLIWNKGTALYQPNFSLIFCVSLASSVCAVAIIAISLIPT